MDGVPSIDDYLTFRANTLTEILLGLLGGDKLSQINFLMNLDFWDWEVESLLEAFDAAGTAPKIKGVNRVIYVRKKGCGMTISETRDELIDRWNNMVSMADEIYDEFDAQDLDGLGLFAAMDFDVYYK